MQFTSRPLIGEISEAEARAMVTAYNADGNGVTKSVWFRLDQVEQLTALLTAEKLVGAGTDGVRVYFAQYTTGTIGDMDKSYVGQNTVVFVSTKLEVDGEGNQFHEDYFDGLQMTPKKHLPPENRGELCQPQCSGTKL